MKHLTLDDIKISKPDFDASKKVPKGQLVTEWLINWIKHSLEFGVADIGDFLPTKEELGRFLDVSSATIQNSFRQIKDMGYEVVDLTCLDVKKFKTRRSQLLGTVIF